MHASYKLVLQFSRRLCGIDSNICSLHSRLTDSFQFKACSCRVDVQVRTYRQRNCMQIRMQSDNDEIQFVIVSDFNKHDSHPVQYERV